MKKLWKILGITALAAVLVPYRVEKDEETGEKSYDALLWHARAKGHPSDGGDGRKVDVTFGLKTPEEKDWADWDDELDDADIQWESPAGEPEAPAEAVEVTDEDLADLEPETPEA